MTATDMTTHNSGTADAPGGSRTARPGKSARTSRRLAIAGVVIVAALGFLVYKGLTSAIVFFRTANQALAQRAQLGNSVFQLEGTVVPGTVHRVGSSQVSFEIRQGGATVDVENTGSPPQMFRPGLPVVVVGHFVGTGDRFSSNQIMVKHSQQYIAQHPDRVRSSS